jgi:hypothetical protein
MRCAAAVEPTPRQPLYFRRVVDGCLQAARAVSLFLPFLGRGAALEASDPVLVAAGGVAVAQIIRRI